MVLLLGALVVGCADLDGVSTSISTSTSVLSGGITETVDLSGVGDEYLPLAGNWGYDVLHYDLALDCDPEDGSISGVAKIEARATIVLDEFHLDLMGLEVQSVLVDGAPADFEREGQELIVDCPETLSVGAEFITEVTYSGTPRSLTAAQGYPEGWQHSGDTVFTLDEPEGAATWYPLNDHPSDKATYSFRLTVSEPYVALANGVLVDTQVLGQERTFVWEMDQPMANYLASVVVDEMVLEESTSPAGVPIRNYFAVDLAAEASRKFANNGEALDFFADLFGPYPFDVYGVAVVDSDTQGSAMENQTMSLYGRDALQGSMQQDFYAELFLSHELAHAWFGNSVTPEDWTNIWLNEGFASYASWLWLDREFEGGLQAAVDGALESLSQAPQVLLGDPGLAQLFGAVVYQRGALTLHALRLSIGDDLFFPLLREWAEANAYGNVTTQDFIDLVQERTVGLVGFHAADFFDSWLYEETLPDMPVTDATS